jgi:hypothetical protein
VEGTKKRRRPRSRWSDEAEGGLNIMGIKTGIKRPETFGNGGHLFWKPKSTTDCGL